MILNRILSYLKWSSSKKNIKIHFTSFIDGKSKLENNIYVGPLCSIVDSVLGRRTYLAHSTIVANAEIGRFCSIGPKVRIGGLRTHPTNAISTSPIFYSISKLTGRPYVEKASKYQEHYRCYIGNDVWIGANSLILDGVSVGDGAIIAAGSVVTKNIEPYSIVGGVPAKFIRYRLDSNIANKLLALKWWEFEDYKLIEVAKFFDPDNGVVDENTVKLLMLHLGVKGD